MKRCLTILLFAILCLGGDSKIRAAEGCAYGFSLGLAYTPDDNLTGVGWNLAGTLEWPVSPMLDVRGTLGDVGFEGDSQGQNLRPRP